MLVEHRVDDVDERLVAVEQPVPSGEQVTLEPALAKVLGQHLHHPTVGRKMIIAGEQLGIPGPVGLLEDQLEPVRGRLVGTHDAEVARIGHDDVAQEGPHHLRGLAQLGGGSSDRHGVGAEVRHGEITEQPATVGVRVGTHPAVAAGRQSLQLRHQPAGRSNSSSGR